MKWHTIEADGSPDAYVRTTMYHQWISWWRRHRHGREYALATAGEVAAPGDLAGDGALRLALARRGDRPLPSRDGTAGSGGTR